MIGLAAISAVSAVALSAPSARSARSTPGCGLSPPNSGWHNLMVPDPLAGNTQRWTRIWVPTGYDPNAPTALIFDLHGYSSAADEQEERTGLREIANEMNFIVVWPHGLDDGGSQTNSWNSVGTVASPGPLGDTCQWADSYSGYACHSSCESTRPCYSSRWSDGCDCSTCADDVLFMELLINKLEAELCVDTRRVHVTGFSNGGMMAYELSQSRLAARIASIAPVGSAPLMGFNNPPSRRMPIMDIKGSSDGIIPANCTGNQCGPNNSTISCDGFFYTSVLDTMRVWGFANGCDGPQNAFHYPTPFDGDTDFWCWSSEGFCAVSTVRCAHRGGHSWPFGTGGNNRRKYAMLVWDFFVANPLPASELPPQLSASEQQQRKIETAALGNWSAVATPPASMLSRDPPRPRCPDGPLPPPAPEGGE